MIDDIKSCPQSVQRYIKTLEKMATRSKSFSTEAVRQKLVDIRQFISEDRVTERSHIRIGAMYKYQDRVVAYLDETIENL